MKEENMEVFGCFQYDSKPALLIGFEAFRIKADSKVIYNAFQNTRGKRSICRKGGREKLSFGKNLVHKQIRN